jgi:hypothetical protein
MTTKSLGNDFATAEANPDGLVAWSALGQTAVLLGNRSTEFWALVGGTEVFARQRPLDTKKEPAK